MIPLLAHHSLGKAYSLLSSRSVILAPSTNLWILAQKNALFNYNMNFLLKKNTSTARRILEFYGTTLGKVSSHRSSDHYGSTNQDQILDDILAF